MKIFQKVRKQAYYSAASVLGALAVAFVSPASLWYIYSGEVPEELLK